MPSPQPATPAASATPKLPAKPFAQPQPNKWQSTYRRAQPVSIAVNSFSMPDAENIPGNILYTALQRPKLLRGGEWRLAMINHIIAVCCCIQAISQGNW